MKVIRKYLKSISSNHPVALTDTHTHKYSTNTQWYIASHTKQHGKHKDTEQWPLRGKRENRLTYRNCVAKSFRKIFRLLNEISQMFLVNDEIKSLPNKMMTCCAIHFPMKCEKVDDLQNPSSFFQDGVWDYYTALAKCTHVPVSFGCPLWKK